MIGAGMVRWIAVAAALISMAAASVTDRRAFASLAVILTMMGASNIVFPERDMAIRLAHNLNASTIMDFLELAPDFSMILANWLEK